MSTFIGLGIVFAAVLGGYAMSGGPFGILVQPNELLVIGGAAAGTLVISAPGKVSARVFGALKSGIKPHAPTKGDYLDLLKLLFLLFQMMRRDGVLALESHLADPKKSTVFSKYPSIIGNHHAIDFLVDGLRQLVDGCSSEDLTMLFETEMDTHHEEAHQPIALIKATSDALPGLGIVAAVLGIIITMSHLDGGPEVIGHHVAAALVGTFLGILLCYGVLSPIATSIEMSAAANHRFVVAIKEGVLAASRGSTPGISVEFARRSIYSDERPSATDLEKAIAALKGSA